MPIARINRSTERHHGRDRPHPGGRLARARAHLFAHRARPPDLGERAVRYGADAYTGDPAHPHRIAHLAEAAAPSATNVPHASLSAFGEPLAHTSKRIGPLAVNLHGTGIGGRLVEPTAVSDVGMFAAPTWSLPARCP